MKKLFTLLTFFLLAAITAQAETETYTAENIWSSHSVLNDVHTCKFGGIYTLTASKNNGSTTPTYVSNGGDIRVYAKGTATLSTTGSSPFSQIVFSISTQGQKRLAEITASTGSVSIDVNNWTVTWTGEASEVTFTVGDQANYGTDGNSKAGQLDFDAISITTGGGTTPDPEPTTTYTVTVANDIANGTVTASPTTAAAGAAITLTATPDTGYELDSWNVTNASTSTAITVTDNKFTMPAANVNVSATFKVIEITALTTMDEIFAAATTAGSTASDTKITFNNWIVSGVKGSNAYVTDGTKGFIVYTKNHGFEVGNILSGTVDCKVQLYNGSAELTALTTTTTGLTVTKGGTITPQTGSIANLSGVNTGAVYTFSDLTYDGTNFSDGENTIKPYNTFITLPTLVDGKKYDVTGVYIQYKETREIAPRSVDDIVLKETINSYTVTIETPENGTLVIKNGNTVVNSGDEVAEGTWLSIICTPANEDYRFLNWQYKIGDKTWVSKYSDVQEFTMPAAPVQFRANFDLIPTYTINWSVDGQIIKSEVLQAGETVSAPTVDDIAGKEFRGWIEYEIFEPIQEEPAYVHPDKALNDVTYYAVLATKTGEGGSSSLTKLNGSSTLADGDDIVIVAKVEGDDGTKYYGMYQETVSNSYVNFFTLDHAPTISDINGDAKKYWTLNASDNNTWKLGDDINGYLSNDATSNNLYVNENSTEVTIAWDETQSKFTIKNGKRWIACRSDLTANNQFKFRGGGNQEEPTTNSTAYFDFYKYVANNYSFSDFTTRVNNHPELSVYIEPSSKVISHNQQIVITTEHAEGDVEIVYTVNGGSEQTYNGPFTLGNVTIPCTISAFAVDNALNEATASVTYTKFVDDKEFTLVTSDSQISTDKEYIIVAKSKHGNYAMSAANSYMKELTVDGEGELKMNIDYRRAIDEIILSEDGNKAYVTTDVSILYLEKDDNNVKKLNTSAGYLCSQNERGIGITKDSEDEAAIIKSMSVEEETNAIRIIYGDESRSIMFNYNDEGSRFGNYKIGMNPQEDAYLYYREASKEPVPAHSLAEIESNGLNGHKYTVTDRLIGVKAVGNTLWAKDDNNSYAKRYKTAETDIDYIQAGWHTDGIYDQSNWIKIVCASAEAAHAGEGKYIEANTVSGVYNGYKDRSHMITLDGDGDLTTDDDAPKYEPNLYCAANFWNDNIYDYVTCGDKRYFFMNPKIEEVCKVTAALWSGNDTFTIYDEDANGNTNTIKGAFVVDWSLNGENGDYSTLLNEKNDVDAYEFTAIVEKVEKSTTASPAPAKLGAMPDVNPTSQATYYVLYPVDFTATGTQIVTGVNDLNAGKTVKGVRYYNVAGQSFDAAQPGLNIVVTEYTDGTHTASKFVR